MPAARAELIADLGAAAESPDFFRSRAFLDAEGVTHSLRINGPDAEVSLPVIVREIEAGGRDAVSPYGYPGGKLPPGANSSPVDPAGVDWAETGLVSVFVRDRVGPRPSLAGATPRSRVQVHDPARPRRLRSRLAEQIRRNARAGWRVGTSPGPDAPPASRAAFVRAYRETMARAGAAERYRFEPAYFDAVLGFERSWLLVATAEEGPGAAAIAAVSDGVLHYYLGGTADAHLERSPFKNVVAAMMDLADELQLPLNLGGGVRPGDGLEDFKRGFANAELTFHTHEIVCDAPAYERLAAGRDAGGFFPAYRAS